MSDELNPFKKREYDGPPPPPVVSFKNPGDSVKGKILKVEYRQDTDMATRKVKTFPDGAPRPVVVLHIQQANGEVVRDFVKGRSVSKLRSAVWAVEGEDESPKNGADYERTFVEVDNTEKVYDLTYERSQEQRELI